MEDFKNIRQIWSSATPQVMPDAARMLSAARKIRRRRQIKAIGFLLLLLSISAVMVFALVFYHSRLLSTRIGEGCFGISIIILLSLNIATLRRNFSQYSYTNEAFLQYLKEEQRHLALFEQRWQIVGFAFAATGLIFYVYELVYRYSTAMYITYVFVAAYLLFAWFFIRPRIMRRKKQKLSALTNRYEQIISQFKS